MRIKGQLSFDDLVNALDMHYTGAQGLIHEVSQDSHGNLIDKGNFMEKFNVGYETIEQYIKQNPGFHYSLVKDGQLNNTQHNTLQYFFSFDYDVLNGKVMSAEEKRRIRNSFY